MKKLGLTATLCLALAACGTSSNAPSSTTTRRNVAVPMVRLQQALERYYGVRNAECHRGGAQAHQPDFACYVASHGALLRLTVTRAGARRRPVVTDCRLVQVRQDQFGTCSVAHRQTPASPREAARGTG
jgi:hypothetical protein